MELPYSQRHFLRMKTQLTKTQLVSTTKRPLFDLRQPLTTADLTTYETELSQLQANILRPHGRKAAVHLFLTFKRDKQKQARQFLRQTVMTSAAEQAAQKQRRSESHTELLTISDRGLFASI